MAWLAYLITVIQFTCSIVEHLKASVPLGIRFAGRRPLSQRFSPRHQGRPRPAPRPRVTRA